MVKKLVQWVYWDGYVDVPETPTPTPAPVQKFTPIDVQTKAQDAIAPQYTKNLFNAQEQQAQKVQPTVQIPTQPQQTQPVASPVSQQETQPSTVPQSTQTIPQATLPTQSSSQKPWVVIPQKSAMPPAYGDKVETQTTPWQPTQQTTAPISDDFYSPENFMYTGMSKQQYDLLDGNWKLQALQSWETFLKQRQWIQWQAEKFQEYTRQKEYLNQQNALKGQMTNVQEQNNKIQSEQQLRSSQQAINNLEQNLNFVWSGWKPAVFKQAMEAMKFQMFDAQRLHSELVTMQENGQKLRDLGVEFDENQFNKQMQDMEYQMNDQVDKVVQQALQGFNSQMMLWQVDSPAKLNELTSKWLDSIDMDVTNVTNRQMWVITNMINQYKTLADEAKTRLAEDAKQKSEYQKWTNTVNEAISKVRGYYVDGNGQAIVWTDGRTVQIPAKAPMEPVFKDWYLITFSTDANGQIVAKPQKVMEQSDMDKINLALKWEELRSKQLENAKLSWASTATTTVQTDPQSVVDFSQNKRGKQNLQCWELVNDYLFKATWKDPSWANRLWNTFTSKVKAIESIWRANWPVEWWVFAFKTGNKDKNGNDIWHTGIVQSVNPDWSINVLEANAEWSKNWSAPVTRVYKDVSKMVFSNQPINPKSQYDSTDITVFNWATPTGKAKLKEDSQYNKFIEDKKKIMKNPDSTINDILSYSAWWTRINQTQESQFSKYAQAMDQITDIQANIKKWLTWPIAWRIRSANPYDINAQTLKAQLTALVPTIARWAYWEVWVLTDADIELYKKTIPNLQSTAELNDALLAFTLKSLANWYKTKLRSVAWGWFDVSWYEWVYTSLTSQADSLLSWVWSGKEEQVTNAISSKAAAQWFNVEKRKK